MKFYWKNTFILILLINKKNLFKITLLKNSKYKIH